MQKAHLIIDLDSIHAGLLREHKGDARIDPLALVRWIESDGEVEVVSRSLYSAGGYEYKFMHFLKSNKFKAVFRGKPIVDITQDASLLESGLFVICSDRPDMCRLAKVLEDKGNEVAIITNNANLNWHCIVPVANDFLRYRNETAQAK